MHGSLLSNVAGHFAGQLIMEAGLRGYSVEGGSEKHCGFIINTGNATAEDVKDVIWAGRVKNVFTWSWNRDEIPVTIQSHVKFVFCGCLHLRRIASLYGRKQLT
ncbi:MAG: hypothetical protein ACLR6I_03640 [Waltera sp.]